MHQHNNKQRNAKSVGPYPKPVLPYSKGIGGVLHGFTKRLLFATFCRLTSAALDTDTWCTNEAAVLFYCWWNIMSFSAQSGHLHCRVMWCGIGGDSGPGRNGRRPGESIPIWPGWSPMCAWRGSHPPASGGHPMPGRRGPPISRWTMWTRTG